MNPTNLTIGLVSPLPPPSGGISSQTIQLTELLRADGIAVNIVQMNTPYRPKWVTHLKGIRALFRMLPYLRCLWNIAGKVQLFDIKANSGWSWHLFAAPAVWVAHFRGIPAIVNYHGGEAEAFLSRSFRVVAPTLKRTCAIVVPSLFLHQVFERFGFQTIIVPNIIDLERFHYRKPSPSRAPRIFVARNLELIYDNATALQAFHLVLKRHPEATLTIAGSGPEKETLQRQAKKLGIEDSVVFTGRVENEHMPLLYADADIMLNPSLADNMPVSILEAFASGIPVVSTNVGGIPLLVEDGKTAILVPPKNPDAMAKAILYLLDNPETAIRISAAAREYAQQFAWKNVRGRLMTVYNDALAKPAILPSTK